MYLGIGCFMGTTRHSKGEKSGADMSVTACNMVS